MKVFYITIVLIFTLTCAEAQTDPKPKNKYRIWVSTINAPFFYQGSLYTVKDSSIIVKSVVVADSLRGTNRNIELRIDQIEIIEARRKNRVGFGGVIGAFTGLAVGGILGFASGDDSNGGLTANEKATLGGITLAIPGALVGVLVGSSKIIIPINRSPLKYNSAKLQLSTFSSVK